MKIAVRYNENLAEFQNSMGRLQDGNSKDLLSWVLLGWLRAEVFELVFRVLVGLTLKRELR